MQKGFIPAGLPDAQRVSRFFNLACHMKGLILTNARCPKIELFVKWLYF